MNEAIKTKLEQLDALCEKYPDSIPLPEAAAFMGIGEEQLRRAVEQGKTTFGFSWVTIAERKKYSRTVPTPHTGYKIPTLAFYAYITGQYLHLPGTAPLTIKRTASEA